MSRITLNFRKSTEEIPAPNQSILVITSYFGSFDSKCETFEQWKPVAYDMDGEEFPHNISFQELSNRDDSIDIMVSYGEHESSLQTFLKKEYLWIPIEESDKIADFLGFEPFR